MQVQEYHMQKLVSAMVFKFNMPTEFPLITDKHGNILVVSRCKLHFMLNAKETDSQLVFLKFTSTLRPTRVMDDITMRIQLKCFNAIEEVLSHRSYILQRSASNPQITYM